MSLLTLARVKAAAQEAFGARMRIKTAAALLNEEVPAEPLAATFDIFLSHSYTDAQIDEEALLGLLRILRSRGLTVYVDWIVDKHLDRGKVTANTADTLRCRMQNSRCLFFATSTNSSSSKWMPWELGYKDGQNGRVAILPLTGGDAFAGQEYLGLYPFVDFTDQSIWIHRDMANFVRFADWLSGKNP